MGPDDWAAALEATSLGVWMRGAGPAYALANLAHLLGMTLLLGAMLLLDLRLLGAGRRLQLDEVSRLLTPLAVGGLLLQLASGVALLAADAVALAGNAALQLKLAVLLAALANAAVFRLRWSRSLADWDAFPPAFGRAQAALSLALWFTVAAAGRLIAYT